MTIKVKICGITNVDDALEAIDLGADYLGFNFYPDSPRYISPENLDNILKDVPYNIGKVGIFVNADAQLVIDVATQFNLDLLQFHGDEVEDYCNQFARPVMKAVRPKSIADLDGLENYDSDYFLVDSFVQSSFGGTGVVSNWDLAREIKKKVNKPMFLSGGLTPENIELAIASVRPFGVDVASGVEHEPGQKSYKKMQEFIKKAKSFNEVK